MPWDPTQWEIKIPEVVSQEEFTTFLKQTNKIPSSITAEQISYALRQATEYLDQFLNMRITNELDTLDPTNKLDVKKVQCLKIAIMLTAEYFLNTSRIYASIKQAMSGSTPFQIERDSFVAIVESERPDIINRLNAGRWLDTYFTAPLSGKRRDCDNNGCDADVVVWVQNYLANNYLPRYDAQLHPMMSDIDMNGHKIINIDGQFEFLLSQDPHQALLWKTDGLFSSDIAKGLNSIGVSTEGYNQTFTIDNGQVNYLATKDTGVLNIGFDNRGIMATYTNGLDSSLNASMYLTAIELSLTKNGISRKLNTNVLPDGNIDDTNTQAISNSDLHPNYFKIQNGKVITVEPLGNYMGTFNTYSPDFTDWLNNHAGVVFLGGDYVLIENCNDGTHDGHRAQLTFNDTVNPKVWDVFIFPDSVAQVDNTTIKTTTTDGKLYCNIDNDTIYYDATTQKVKAKNETNEFFTAYTDVASHFYIETSDGINLRQSTMNFIINRSKKQAQVSFSGWAECNVRTSGITRYWLAHNPNDIATLLGIPNTYTTTYKSRFGGWIGSINYQGNDFSDDCMIQQYTGARNNAVNSDDNYVFIMQRSSDKYSGAGLSCSFTISWV